MQTEGLLISCTWHEGLQVLYLVGRTDRQAAVGCALLDTSLRQ